jgi:hypothetical protein
MLKVEGEPDLVRTSNGVIQNINQNEYQAYMAKRRAIVEQRDRMQRLEQEVAEMKNSIATILNLLLEKK